MHWHTYRHVGSGADVPEFLSHWLHKPASSIEETFQDPEEAVEWLSMAFSEVHTSPDRQPQPPVESRRLDSIEQLSMGNNILYSSWTHVSVSTSTLANFYAISCPPPGGSATCPEGRRDRRPETAAVMTGIP